MANFVSNDNASSLMGAINQKINRRTQNLKVRLAPSLDNVWETKTWSGLSSIYGSYIWTDGDNIYYSSGSDQYILDKSTSAWESKTWNGLTNFPGSSIWSDGNNIYCSYSIYDYQTSTSTYYHYILDKSTSTWSEKTWNGLTNFNGQGVWTDGENIYYSYGSVHYVLDKSTSTWSTKTWTGSTYFDGQYIWTDGENIYHSNGSSNQYVLDKSNLAWVAKTWNGITAFNGDLIWTDGKDIYYSNGTNIQYILDKSTSTWSSKTWDGFTDIIGDRTWTDGKNIYHSNGSNQYIYKKQLSVKNSAKLPSSDLPPITSSVTSGSTALVTSGGVYTYVDTMITQALTGSY